MQRCAPPRDGLAPQTPHYLQFMAMIFAQARKERKRRMQTKQRRNETEPVPPQTLRDVEDPEHPGGHARSRLGDREQFVARDHFE